MPAAGPLPVIFVRTGEATFPAFALQYPTRPSLMRVAALPCEMECNERIGGTRDWNCVTMRTNVPMTELTSVEVFDEI